MLVVTVRIPATKKGKEIRISHVLRATDDGTNGSNAYNKTPNLASST